MRGTWVSTPAAVNSVIVLQVRPYARNGLSIIIPPPAQTLNVHLDGKDYPGAGGRAVLSARRLDSRTVEIVRKSADKIAQTRQIKLSGDLKTLTMTVHLVGKAAPYVYVFERQ